MRRGIRTRRNRKFTCASRRLRLEVRERRMVMSAEAFELIGLDRIRTEFPFIDGSGVNETRPQTLVVIDGTHPDLDDNLVLNLDFVGRSRGRPLTAPADYHGTHIAGTVAAENPAVGVAFDANLIGMNVFGEGDENKPTLDSFDALATVCELVDGHNIVAFNMSIGFGFFPNDFVDHSRTREDARLIQKLDDQGGVVISAPGNRYASLDETSFVENSGVPEIVSTVNVGVVWGRRDPDNDNSHRWARRAVDGKNLEPDLYVASQLTQERADTITSFYQRPPHDSARMWFASGTRIRRTLPFALQEKMRNSEKTRVDSRESFV